jgi:phosphoglycerol transferase
MLNPAFIICPRSFLVSCCFFNKPETPEAMPRKKTLLELLTYAVAVLLCISILAWVAHLWNADFSVPLWFESDALFYQALVKGIIENGWVLHNGSIGMPAGFDLHDVPIPDSLNFGLIKLISFFAPSSADVLNIFALLTFPLITITSLFVFRHFRLSRTTSIVASLLYAFLPYHFLRLGGHTLLSAYYAVPLATLVIVWAFSTEPVFFRHDETKNNYRLSILSRKSLISIVVCAVVASTGIYYAFFACFFLLVAVIYNLLTRQRTYSTLSAGILIFLIFLGVVINLLPNLYYKSAHGPNMQAATRSPADAEVYGLKITQLVLPSDYHRVAFWRRFKTRYNTSAPLSNENSVASLGVVGTLGFLILLVEIFGYKGRASNPPPDLQKKLSILNLSAVLLGTIGGFGSLFAYFISPQIRAYNRISIYIGFFTIMAFFLCFEALFKNPKKTKKSNLLFLLLLAVILITGILDQTPSFYPTGMTSRSFKESYRREADFIRQVETAVPAGTMIFQLPYVPCPENPPVNKMKDYDHFRAYLHSKSLRWSYGAMKGRMTDGWQRAITEKPVEEFVALASLSGYGGIYLDRFGYSDMGAELEANLSRILTAIPMVSSDKRLVFFSMSEFNKKAIPEREKLLSSALLPVWGEGFSNFGEYAAANGRWSSSEGRLYIYNLSGSEKQATIEMTLSTGRKELSHVAIESPVYNERFNINEDGKVLSQPVRVPSGITPVRLKCDARRAFPPTVFKVTNFRLVEGPDH